MLSFFLFVNKTAKAQKNKTIIDSLEQLLLTQKDSDLVKTYNELTWQYRTISADKAIEYGNKAVASGKRINFLKGVAQAYNDMGVIYYDKQDYPKALQLYNEAMKIRSKLNDKKGIAALYNKFGIVYQTKGDYVLALDYQQKALSLYEELKYDLGISYSLNNIAILNYNIGNTDEALKYNLKSIELKKKIKDDYGLSGSYVNVANIFYRQKKYSKAIEYNLMALDLCRKIGDKEYLSATLNNLCSNYLGLNDNDSALVFALESYGLRKELNDKKSMISCLVNLSRIYLNKQNYSQAQKSILEALRYSKEFDALPELPALYGITAEYYEATKNYTEAIKYQRLQYSMRDSLLNEDLNSKITEMNTRYETEKKEKQLIESKLEINEKEFEVEQARNKLYYTLALFAFVLLIVFIIYNRYRLKQKIEFNQEMLLQQEIATRKIIEAEEKERSRIARELHDGVGQQLAVVKLTMSNLQDNITNHETQNQKLINNAIATLDDSIKEVRTVSHSMMPNALVKSGLEKAINEFAERISSDKLQVNCDIHLEAQRLNITTESIIYRVIQEIISNILKHAQAKNVTIQLIQHDDELSILIEDDGKGFDVNEVNTNGIGLQNIRTRISYLKGDVHIDSTLGKGTTISIEIPLLQVV
jgi:two-component system, NarL family, sensor kinase